MIVVEKKAGDGSRRWCRIGCVDPIRMAEDTRCARPALPEMDGFDCFVPRVGLVDSANPGLDDATPLGS